MSCQTFLLFPLPMSPAFRSLFTYLSQIICKAKHPRGHFGLPSCIGAVGSGEERNDLETLYVKRHMPKTVALFFCLRSRWSPSQPSSGAFGVTLLLCSDAFGLCSLPCIPPHPTGTVCSPPSPPPLRFCGCPTFCNRFALCSILHSTAFCNRSWLKSAHLP